MLGVAHVAAVTSALLLAVVVLVLPKGSSRHVVLGAMYVAVLAVGNVAALLVREQSGDLGPFHLLAVVSLLTIAGGVVTSPRRRRGSVTAHAHFMLWSVLGLTAAGMAQLAGSAIPLAAPLPVLLVISASIVVGFLTVPKAAQRAVRDMRIPSRTLIEPTRNSSDDG